MAKRWRIRPHDVGRIQQLERAASVSPVVAQLLLCRGVADPDSARSFLQTKLSDLRDPELLPGLTAAADRIESAIRGGQHITVYGDYDADGMTATAILVRCLNLLGAKADFYVPNRLEDGYGLSEEALRRLASRGTQLVITVDCGIASLQAVAASRALGLDVVITDHHTPGPTLPEACAVVHPALPGHDYPFDGLCGAGVAFKLAWALCRRMSQADRVHERHRVFLLRALSLAAIGTVADVVPLLDENRLIVRHGLAALHTEAFCGIRALMDVAQLSDKPQLTSEDIAFSLAPRLNAAGRLGQADLAVDLMTTEDTERARQLADYIGELNGQRDGLERSILLAAQKQIKHECDLEKDAALVLAGRGWHVGVIGIVAGRLAEKYGRPTVVIALDELGRGVATGSGRSACGVNLYDALRECAEHLVGFGGHAAAAGLRLDEAHVERFRSHFREHVASVVKPEDRVAEITIDVETTLGQLTLSAVSQMEQLAPFGHCNPRPVLCTSGVRLAEPPRRMGADQRHLAVQLVQHERRVRAVAFGQGEWADALTAAGGELDIAYRPVINEFRGWRNVELHLVDWRPSRAAVGAEAAAW